MRIVVTGQVGLDKKPFLERAAALAAAEGHQITLCNIGEMMYAEAPDVAAGRILDMPLSRLHGLRRSVFKDVLARCQVDDASQGTAHLLVNTHATFRWRHGLFYAFDYDQMKALDAKLYVVLVDNIDCVHRRLRRDGYTDHTLKDLMVWREEEILATELLAQIVRPSMYQKPAAFEAKTSEAGQESRGGGHGCFYICALGHDPDSSGTAATLERLIVHPRRKKAYLSYPMSHLQAGGSGDVMAEIENFRREMRCHFTCFDPGDVEEKHLCTLALKAAEDGHRTVDCGPAGEQSVLETSQLLEIIPDIDGQIYARDFKLIDQSDMIISMIPALEGGRPGLSSGVERELQHAHEATKDVFVIWEPAAAPSPFITETATRVFRSVTEAIAFFGEGGYLLSPPAGSLFA